MGDKAKNRDSGKGKKLKARKAGNRPHEQREREALINEAPTINPRVK